MPVIPPSATAAPEIDDGLYEATWLGSEEKFVEADAFGKNHKLEIHLEIDLGNGEVEHLDPLVNWAWSERATLYKFALGFGAVADLTSPFDTEMLDGKGKKAQVLIKTDTEKSAWPKVVDVIAIKKNGARAPAPAPTVDDAPFDTDDKAPLTDSLAEGVALSEWFESVKAIGYTPKEILDHAQGKYGKAPKDLTPAERDELSQELGV